MVYSDVTKIFYSLFDGICYGDVTKIFNSLFDGICYGGVTKIFNSLFDGICYCGVTKIFNSLFDGICYGDITKTYMWSDTILSGPTDIRPPNTSHARQTETPDIYEFRFFAFAKS